MEQMYRMFKKVNGEREIFLAPRFACPVSSLPRLMPSNPLNRSAGAHHWLVQHGPPVERGRPGHQ